MVRHPEANGAINAALPTMVTFVVRVEGVEVVAEKPRATGPCVGDQRFGVAQFQLEVVVQERSKLVFNGLSFGFWAGKSDKPIIGVANIPKAAKGGVVGVPRRDALGIVHALACRLRVTPSAGKIGRFGQGDVGWIGFAPVATGVGRLHDLFDVLVEPVQDQIGENRADDTSYNVAKRLVEFDFSITIPRERLRSGYGAGFRGAPLNCDQPQEHPDPRDSGRQGDEARTTQAPDAECAPEL